MRLLRYRVTNFRSVSDSGWVETDDVTALIGVNESGKSNLLIPLWKLKPAREGEIRPTSDYPKTMFAEIRENPGRFRFVSAEFATGSFAARLASMSGLTPEESATVRVDRYFDGNYVVRFPRHDHPTTAPAQEVFALLQGAVTEIEAMPPLAKEEAQKADLVAGLQSIVLGFPDEAMSPLALETLAGSLRALAPQSPAKTSSIFPRLEALAGRDYRPAGAPLCGRSW